MVGCRQVGNAPGLLLLVDLDDGLSRPDLSGDDGDDAGQTRRVGDHQDRRGVLALPSQHAQVDLGEQIAALDPLTGADGGAEALPLEFDGVQTDVHQQFDAVIGLDAVGVAGVHHRHERACRRRHHAKGAVALGGDSHTVAQRRLSYRRS